MIPDDSSSEAPECPGDEEEVDPTSEDTAALDLRARVKAANELSVTTLELKSGGRW